MICDTLLKKYDEVCSLNKMGWFEETKATKNTSIRHSSHHRRTVLQYRFRVSEIQAALRNVFRTFSVRRLSYGLRCIVSCFCSSVFLCIPDYPLTKPRFFCCTSHEKQLPCVCVLCGYLTSNTIACMPCFRGGTVGFLPEMQKPSCTIQQT